MTQSKKQLLLQTLYKTGLLRLLIASQRNKITILMLHGVIDPTVPSAWKPLRPQLTTDQLSRALSVLSRYYQFVSLTEATEMLAGFKPLVPNSLVLTFDDGYRNNLTFALPILRQFKAPATIFLCTGNVTDQKPFWFDRLDYAVQLMENNSASRRTIPELAAIDFSNRETLTNSFITFIRKEKNNYPTDIAMRSAMANLTERMEQCSGRGLGEIFADDPWSCILSWDEVKQAASEIYFGSHSVNHSQLGILPLETAKKELISSREIIEFYTNYPCKHLAYPNGSFNKDLISLVKNCNYSSAVTTIPDTNQPGDNLLTLRRFPFPHTGSPTGIIAATTTFSTQWQKISKSFS